ncbi:hypothetical protein FPQ18DRAFT_102359 [Pyronema domesticum]|nr:hypothetical protein FPQ18DRAFT_102359 [Pyronema domesticum]
MQTSASCTKRTPSFTGPTCTRFCLRLLLLLFLLKLACARSCGYSCGILRLRLLNWCGCCWCWLLGCHGKLFDLFDQAAVVGLQVEIAVLDLVLLLQTNRH